MTSVLVTRPIEHAAATAARLKLLGHDPLVMPLFEIVPVPWSLPAGDFDSLLLTSAAAARRAGPSLQDYAALPCYCVGAATVAAAIAAGMTDVRTPATAGVRALLDFVAAAGHNRILHLAGRDVVDILIPASLTLERVVVYASEARHCSEVELQSAAKCAVALAYSPRGAHALARALPDAVKANISLAAISRTAAIAAGPGWASVAAAATPDEDALFAAAGLLCEKHPAGEQARAR